MANIKNENKDKQSSSLTDVKPDGLDVLNKKYRKGLGIDGEVVSFVADLHDMEIIRGLGIYYDRKASYFCRRAISDYVKNVAKKQLEILQKKYPRPEDYWLEESLFGKGDVL